MTKKNSKKINKSFNKKSVSKINPQQKLVTVQTNKLPKQSIKSIIKKDVKPRHHKKRISQNVVLFERARNKSSNPSSLVSPPTYPSVVPYNTDDETNHDTRGIKDINV